MLIPIHTRFLSLDLERHTSCNFDGVKIFEGLNTGASGEMLGVFCGSHSDTLPTLDSRGNRAAVKFFSDFSSTASGFSIAVEFKTGNVQLCIL